MDHNKSYPSIVHMISSIVRLWRDFFNTILFQSGVAMPPYEDPDWQQYLSKTLKDGAIHNSFLLLDAHISNPFNPG